MNGVSFSSMRACLRSVCPSGNSYLYWLPRLCVLTPQESLASSYGGCGVNPSASGRYGPSVSSVCEPFRHRRCYSPLRSISRNGAHRTRNGALCWNAPQTSVPHGYASALARLWRRYVPLPCCPTKGTPEWTPSEGITCWYCRSRGSSHVANCTRSQRSSEGCSSRCR